MSAVQESRELVEFPELSVERAHRLLGANVGAILLEDLLVERDRAVLVVQVLHGHFGGAVAKLEGLRAVRGVLRALHEELDDLFEVACVLAQTRQLFEGPRVAVDELEQLAQDLLGELRVGERELGDRRGFFGQRTLRLRLAFELRQTAQRRDAIALAAGAAVRSASSARTRSMFSGSDSSAFTNARSAPSASFTQIALPRSAEARVELRAAG